MNQSTRELLAEFLSSCRAEGRSPQAIKGLRSRVPKLFSYLDECSLECEALRSKDAQAYVGWLRLQLSSISQAPYSMRTVASFLTAAAAFYQYLSRRGLILANPFRETRKLKTEKRIPRGLLKESEMETLLEELSRFDEKPALKEALRAYKLHVIAELMYATGMRVSEVAALSVSDVDFSRAVVTVHEAKGGYPRLAYLGEFSREVLRLYVEKLRELCFSVWNKRNEKLLFGTGWERLGHMVDGELARNCTRLSLPPMRSPLSKRRYGPTSFT